MFYDSGPMNTYASSFLIDSDFAFTWFAGQPPALFAKEQVKEEAYWQQEANK